MSGNVALRAALHEAKEAADISLAEFLAELRVRCCFFHEVVLYLSRRYLRCICMVLGRIYGVFISVMYLGYMTNTS